jgi:hypothetical protein
MSTEQIRDQIEDSAVAVTDANLLAAGIRELHDALLAGRLDSLTVTDVARDALPRLDALRAWLQEQIVEVTL